MCVMHMFLCSPFFFFFSHLLDSVTSVTYVTNPGVTLEFFPVLPADDDQVHTIPWGFIIHLQHMGSQHMCFSASCLSPSSLQRFGSSSFWNSDLSCIPQGVHAPRCPLLPRTRLASGFGQFSKTSLEPYFPTDRHHSPLSPVAPLSTVSSYLQPTVGQTCPEINNP